MALVIGKFVAFDTSTLKKDEIIHDNKEIYDIILKFNPIDFVYHSPEHYHSSYSQNQIFFTPNILLSLMGYHNCAAPAGELYLIKLKK